MRFDPVSDVVVGTSPSDRTPYLLDIHEIA